MTELELREILKHRRLLAPRTVLRTVPPRLDEIVMKALATDADDRHHSASALWADLQSCPLDDQPLGAAVEDLEHEEHAPSEH